MGPNIDVPSNGVTATVDSQVQIAATTLDAGTSVALPTLTITDPGVIPSGDTVTVDFGAFFSGAALDPAHVPTVTVTGAGVLAGTPTVVNGAVSFTVTKPSAVVAATFVVSGLYAKATSSTSHSGALGMYVFSSHLAGSTTVYDDQVAPFSVGAITHLIPAAAGVTAPETAGILFEAAVGTAAPTSVVLASDVEPQDAESATYLAEGAPGPRTGILLTNPTTLSPAVTTALTAHPTINTVFIVGGTSVVSEAIEAQLKANYTVVRLAGPTAYDTNAAVVNYVALHFGTGPQNLTLDYSVQSRFNDTAGTSSAPTTGVGSVKTAIVASGDSRSFQDGIVSGPLSADYYLPVILTTSASLSPTALALLTGGGYQQVILLGGPGAVSDAVEAQLTTSVADGGAGVAVFRVAGSDASDTSTKMAAFLTAGNEIDDFSYTDQGTADGGVLIARGTGFQDALAAGPYAGGNGNTPILLTENATTLGAPLTAYLHTLGGVYGLAGGIYSVQAIGGSSSVTPAVQQAAIDAEVSGVPALVF